MQKLQLCKVIPLLSPAQSLIITTSLILYRQGLGAYAFKECVVFVIYVTKILIPKMFYLDYNEAFIPAHLHAELHT
jgi:hypothetical protein